MLRTILPELPASHPLMKRCGLCEKEMSRGSFARHGRTHDPDGREYVCQYPGCHFAASQSYSLTIHKKIHTKERNLVCPFGDYKTGDPGNYRRHCARVHGLIITRKPRVRKAGASGKVSRTKSRQQVYTAPLSPLPVSEAPQASMPHVSPSPLTSLITEFAHPDGNILPMNSRSPVADTPLSPAAVQPASPSPAEATHLVQAIQNMHISTTGSHGPPRRSLPQSAPAQPSQEVYTMQQPAPSYIPQQLEPPQLVQEITTPPYAIPAATYGQPDMSQGHNIEQQPVFSGHIFGQPAMTYYQTGPEQMLAASTPLFRQAYIAPGQASQQLTPSQIIERYSPPPTSQQFSPQFTTVNPAYLSHAEVRIMLPDNRAKIISEFEARGYNLSSLTSFDEQTQCRILLDIMYQGAS